MTSILSRLLVLIALLAGSVVMAFPFWWMFVTSLSTEREASSSASIDSFRWFPTNPQWSNYGAALTKFGSNADFDEPRPAAVVALAGWHARRIATEYRGFLDALANSVVITTLCVVGNILSCSLAGYGFARARFRGRDGAFLLMIATMMLPAQVTMIPLFLLFRSFGWINTLLPLVVPAFFGAPFFIFMFRQFFAQIPEAVVEAAKMDGCSHLGIWWRIMLPMSTPVIAITAIFTFIGTWNDFLGPLIYLQTQEQMTLAVALASFQNQYGDFREAHYLMAASLITMAPCIILFLAAQRQFMSGLNLGAVKG